MQSRHEWVQEIHIHTRAVAGKSHSKWIWKQKSYSLAFFIMWIWTFDTSMYHCVLFTSLTLRFSYLPPALQYYIFNRVAAASFAYLMASTMHFFKSAKFFRPQSFRAEASQLLWPLATQWFEIAKTSQYISSSDLHNFCFLWWHSLYQRFANCSLNLFCV